MPKLKVEEPKKKKNVKKATKVVDTVNPVKKPPVPEGRGFRRTIASVTPEEFVKTLNDWSESVDGFTAGIPPMTFRYITKTNNFVMITADVHKKIDTLIQFTEYTTADKENILDEIIEVYKVALKKQEEHIKKAEVEAKKRAAERLKETQAFIKKNKTVNA